MFAPSQKEKKCNHIVTCQAHPALVKRGQWSVCVFQFWLSCPVHLLTDQRIPGPCLVAARSQGGLLETPPRWHATIYLNMLYAHTYTSLANFIVTGQTDGGLPGFTLVHLALANRTTYISNHFHEGKTQLPSRVRRAHSSRP